MCPGFTLTIPGMKPAQLLSTEVLSAASTRESQLRCLSGPVDPAGESLYTWKRILASLASNLLGASAFRAAGAAGEPFTILLQTAGDSVGRCWHPAPHPRPPPAPPVPSPSKAVPAHYLMKWPHSWCLLIAGRLEGAGGALRRDWMSSRQRGECDRNNSNKCTALFSLCRCTVLGFVFVHPWPHLNSTTTCDIVLASSRF